MLLSGDSVRMKHLASAESQYELLGLKELLGNSGIPAMLQAELAPYSKAMLFVLIDEQYDDASMLMKDPAHQVADPIDQEVLLSLEAEATASGGILWASIGKYAVAAVLVVVFVLVYLIDRFS